MRLPTPLVVVTAVLLGTSTQSGVAVAQHSILFGGDGEPVYSLAISPDGNTLASGSSDGVVRLWDLRRRGRPAELWKHVLPVYSVAFSPDGKKLASGSADCTARIWDVAGKRQTAVFDRYRGKVYSVAFSPSGKILATGGGVFVTLGEVKLWDIANRKLWADLTGHQHVVSSLTFSPRGSLLASVGGRPLTLGEAKMWKMSNRKHRDFVTDPVGEEDQLLCAAFSPDAKTLAVAGRNSIIRLWDVAKRKERVSWRGHVREVIFLTFAPDGGFLVSAGYDNTVRFWDPSTGSQLAMLYDPCWQWFTGEILGIALSRDGKRLATGRLDGRISLWDVDDLLRAGTTPLYEYDGWPVPGVPTPFPQAWLDEEQRPALQQ